MSLAHAESMFAACSTLANVIITPGHAVTGKYVYNVHISSWLLAVCCDFRSEASNQFQDAYQIDDSLVPLLLSSLTGLLYIPKVFDNA